jgi:hypothetical protein
VTHMHEGNPFQKGCHTCERRLLNALGEAFTQADAEMSLEEVDAELRAAGLDPVAVGNRIAALVEKLDREARARERDDEYEAAAEAHERDFRGSKCGPACGFCGACS